MNNLEAALKVIDEMENEAGGGIGTPEREYTIVFSSDLREVLTALCSEMEWRASRNAADKARDNALPRAEFQRLVLEGIGYIGAGFELWQDGSIYGNALNQAIDRLEDSDATNR